MSELYKLPDGWEWKKLDELTEVNLGKTPTRSKSEYFLGDKVWLSIRDLKDDYVSDSNEKLTDEAVIASNIKIVPKGTLLMSFKLTLGKTAFANCDLYTNEAIASLPIKDKSILDKYFLKYSIGVIDLEKEVDNAVKGKTLNKEKMKNLDIPLPPLEEQKRIVAKLDILFAKIDKAISLHQKNIDEADIFMASVLNDVFVELEEKYEKKELSDLVSKLGDGLHGTPKYDDNGEYYFINGANVKDNKIIINHNTKKVNEDEYNKYKKELNDRTIFVSINGTIGNVGLYNNEKCILGKSACYFNLLENIDKIYITYVLKNGDFQEYIEKSSTGATIKNVSLKTMRSYRLTIPPLKTQQKVVAYLDEISQKMEKIKQIQKEKMQSLKELKASILDQAFKGEL